MMNVSDVRLPEAWRLEWLEDTDSTNQRLKEHPPEHGFVLGAETQSAGRGRRGAPWISDPAEGLTFSIMLLPLEPRGLWPRLALATGLAVAQALGRLGIEAEVKWPNDVLVARAKIAGILVEAVGNAAIIGIGLNVNSSAFPTGIEATSMFLETGREWEREEVLSVVLQEIDAQVRQIGSGFDDLLDRLRLRCALTGKRVSLRAPSGELHGFVRGIGGQGELLLETAAGLVRLLQADEVRVLPEIRKG